MKTVALCGWGSPQRLNFVRARLGSLGVKVIQNTACCERVDVLVCDQVNRSGSAAREQVRRAERDGIPIVELGYHFAGEVVGTENLERWLRENP